MRKPNDERSVLLAAAVLLSFVLSCGGGRPSLDPMFLTFDRFERETTSMDPGERATSILECARRNRDEAAGLITRLKTEEATPFLERAVADVELAWSLLRLERSERREAEARQAMERARQEWENALITLEGAEQSAEQTAEGISRTLPVPERAVLPPFPDSSLQEDASEERNLGALRRQWDLWAEAASDRSIPIADLRNRFDQQIRAAEDLDAKEESRARDLYAAWRILQLLESRVRSTAAEQSLAYFLASCDRLHASAEEAYHATINLQSKVAARLEAEMRSREDTMFSALQKLEGEFARITKEARGTIVSLSDILFEFDKVSLKRDVEYNLVRVATILNQYPEMKIIVEGHTDNVGTENYNLELSKKRAQVVHDFLVSQGVSVSRMTVMGYGLSRPIAPNNTEKGRSRNRRVDLVIREDG